MHGVTRAPLAYNIRKTVICQTYGKYPWYASHDDEMIARMLHFPPDKNKLLMEREASSVKIQQST